MKICQLKYSIKKRQLAVKKTPRHGFEPRLDDPESPVLPLDDLGIFSFYEKDA